MQTERRELFPVKKKKFWARVLRKRPLAALSDPARAGVSRKRGAAAQAVPVISAAWLMVCIAATLSLPARASRSARAATGPGEMAQAVTGCRCACACACEGGALGLAGRHAARRGAQRERARASGVPMRPVRRCLRGERGLAAASGRLRLDYHARRSGLGKVAITGSTRASPPRRTSPPTFSASSRRGRRAALVLAHASGRPPQPLLWGGVEVEAGPVAWARVEPTQRRRRGKGRACVRGVLRKRTTEGWRAKKYTLFLRICARHVARGGHEKRRADSTR